VQKKSQATLKSETAWQKAEAAGFDMSLVEMNLERTPWERILNHSRALKLAMQLRDAMHEHRYAGT
jgi:hypothetical protein